MDKSENIFFNILFPLNDFWYLIRVRTKKMSDQHAGRSLQLLVWNLKIIVRNITTLSHTSVLPQLTFTELTIKVLELIPKNWKFSLIDFCWLINYTRPIAVRCFIIYNIIRKHFRFPLEDHSYSVSNAWWRNKQIRNSLVANGVVFQMNTEWKYLMNKR